ncbi:unnamed protein product, partial [Brassica rapa]
VLPIDAFIPPSHTCSKVPLKKNCRIFLVSPTRHLPLRDMSFHNAIY